MARESGVKRRLVYNPYKYPLEYPEVMPFFENLRVAFDVVADLREEYNCKVHTGLAKWVSVGLFKNQWFRKVWRLNVGLNPYYFYGREVFYTLTVNRYVQTPILLAPLMRRHRGDVTWVKKYTTEEVKDAGLLERDIRAVLDAELVTGKAWDF